MDEQPDGQIEEYVKVVPFSRANFPAETSARFKACIRASYSLINSFHRTNAKLVALPEPEKIWE